MSKKIKVVSLFTGIGAWEKAMSNLSIDYDLIHFSEIEEKVATAYCAIHNEDNSKNLGDITKIDMNNVKDFDILFYSPPCQAFSVAGNQLGFFDDRGTLFFDALKIIKAKKPKYALMENVKGLVGEKFKLEFEIMLRELENAGYNNYSKILNAKDYGIPQRRERVFIVSIRSDIDDNSFSFPSPILNSSTINDMCENKVDRKYFIKDDKVRLYMQNHSYKKLPNQEVSYCIDANYHKGTSIEGFVNKKRRQLVEVPSQSVANLEIINSTNTFEMRSRIRRLTPKECFRLMGFTDIDYEKAKKALIDKYYNGIDRSDYQMYKMAGNSIVVNVVEAIIDKLNID